MKEGDLHKLFERLLDACHVEGLFKNCTKCVHWHTKEEFCTKYKERPPATVIVKGCPSFELDEIPF